MQIKPNRTVLEGEVLQIRRMPDGFGADVTLRVEANLTAGHEDDCSGAQTGETLIVFAAAPEALRKGGRYRIEAKVHGGPKGERVVVGKADPIDEPGAKSSP